MSWGPPPYLLMAESGAGPRRSVTVVDQSGDPVWSVEAVGGHGQVRSRHAPKLYAFLLLHWDDFIDAGWEMDSWFLIDCRACGAWPFTGCRHKATGRPIRYVHADRVA